MITSARKIPDFSMIFGAPGTGKTTIAVAIALKCLKRKMTVYTNFPCVGCYQIDFSDIGKYAYEDSICIIDEAGIDASNREWKSIPKATIDYLKKARHRHNKWIFLSQGWDDADKKIRGLCTAFYKLRKVGPLTVCRQIKKTVDIDENTHQPADMFYRVPILSAGLSFVFRPRWYKHFDSWEAEALPDPPKNLW